MIIAPWANTELQSISAALPLTSRQNIRGQAGCRMWNITPWWWDLFAEGDPSRAQAICPPWSFLEFEFQQDLLELLITTATDLNSLPLSSSPTWRFAFEFIGDPADIRPQVLALSQQLARTDVIQTQPVQAWGQTNAAAVSSASTTSRAAGALGVKHVASALSFGWSATTALAAISTVTVNLRDGASGAGTVLRSYTFTLPAAVIAAFAFQESGLNINGSPATAMTLEFAAGVGNLQTFVNLSGFDTT